MLALKFVLNKKYLSPNKRNHLKFTKAILLIYSCTRNFARGHFLLLTLPAVFAWALGCRAHMDGCNVFGYVVDKNTVISDVAVVVVVVEHSSRTSHQYLSSSDKGGFKTLRTCTHLYE